MSAGESILVLGRNKLRNNLRALADPDRDYRLMLISGHKGTGKTFSNHLIEHVARSRGIGTVLTDIASGMELAEACEHIADQMGLDVDAMRAGVLADQATPDRIGRKFAHWLLRETAARPGERWWLIFDGLDEADRPSPELRAHLVYWLTRAIAPPETPPALTARPAPGRPQFALILLGEKVARQRTLASHMLEEPLDFLRRDDIRTYLKAYADEAQAPLPTSEINRLVDLVAGARPEPFKPPAIQEILKSLSGVLANLEQEFVAASTAKAPSGEAEPERQRFVRPVIKPPAPDLLEPFREAAAVLVACDPFTLRPAATKDPDRLALDILPELVPSPYLAGQHEFPWCLPPGARQRTLARLHSAAALRKVLSANPKRPQLLLQRLLDDAIGGKSFAVEQLGFEELGALATVAGWLAGTELGPALNPDELRRKADEQRDLAALRRLAGDTFTGRQRETLTLRRHLDSRTPQILFVTGVGGMGKSALLCHVLLSRLAQVAPAPWLRLDLDSPRILPNRPGTLLEEASEQLKRRHPDLITILQDLDKQLQLGAYELGGAQAESRASSGSRLWPTEKIFIEAIRFALGANSSGDFVLWIDTFEEAQRLGRQMALDLASFLWRLVQQEPRLRVIVSGRTPLQTEAGSTGLLGEHLPKRAFRQLRLRGLPQPMAEALLGKLLETGDKSRAFTGTVIKKAARSLHGNPLALRFGAELLRKKGGAILNDLGALGAEALQKWLYSRILEDLPEEPELKQLAFPGLIVRRITPEIIEHVLAEPCLPGPVPPGRAAELFQLLAREITLLEEDPDDSSLRHRTDVRQLMLEGFALADPRVVRAIDQNAVAYWSKREGATARAEELYHRLRLGDPPELLEERWLPAAAPLLRTALDELPPASPARLWLAGHLHAVLDEDELGGTAQSEWETQAALEARRALDSGSPAQALNALRARSRRLAGSALDGLEARALLFQENPQAALKVIRRGVARSRRTAPRTALDLWLLEAFIHERKGDFRRSGRAIQHAWKLVPAVGDPVAMLTVGVRARRLKRKDGPRGGSLVRADLPAVAREIGPNLLAAQPTLLREVAAELGEELPEFLQLAADHFLVDLWHPLSNREILDFMERAGSPLNDTEDTLQFSQKAEIITMATSRLSELLASLPQEPTSAGQPARVAIQQLFQKNVDEILNKEYSAARPPEALAVNPVDLFQERPELRQELESRIAGLSVEMLQKVSRLVLRTDYINLSAGKDARAIAHELVERALKLGQVEQTVRFLAQLVPALGKLAALFFH